MGHKQIQKIGVIAPSSKLTLSDLNECLRGLRDLDIDFHINKPLFKKETLCAHAPEKRLKDLQQALNSELDYIWCLRGGYGCLHLIDSLLKSKRPKQKSRLIGFSDITILHYFLNQKWNWPSLHWCHLNGFLKEENGHNVFDTQRFTQSLKDLKTQSHFYFKDLKPLNSKAQNLKQMKSEIVGGNLITLQSLIGLDLPKPKDQILFLEEIDEPVYKIDRALTQLALTGWLKGVKAILLGSFTHKNKEVEKETIKYFKDKFKDFKIPVFSGLKAGHIPDQLPIFFNTESEIYLDKQKFTLKNRNGFI